MCHCATYPTMNSNVFKIEKNETYGRYVIATRDLKPGELILKEKPVFVGAQIAQPVHLCFKCNKLLKYRLQICKDCAIATVCSAECEGSNHKNECSVLKQTGLRASDIICNPQIVLILRCFLLQKYDKEKWQEMTSLESHLEQRKNTDIWKTHQKNVTEVMESLKLLCKDDIDKNVIQEICGILDVNSFEIRPPNLNGITTNPSDYLRGLFLNASLMTHDCIGNTLLAVDDDFVMTVVASVPIQCGEMIFFNYGNCLQGTYNRRFRLNQGKYFDCDCRRCSDPSELGTYLSSIRCRKCGKGNVIPSIPLSDTYRTAWNCESCGTVFRGILIKSTINAVIERLESLSPENVLEAEKLLQRLHLTLSPKHYLILELKQSLIAMYDKLYTDKATQKKIALCKDVINVLKIIEPGISRLQAIALYQLHAAQVNSANNLYQSKQMSPGKYLDCLLEAETNLTAAVKMLVYEPPKSSEGRLAQQTLGELKILRNMIQQMKIAVEIKVTDKDDVLKHVKKNKCKIK